MLAAKRRVEGIQCGPDPRQGEAALEDNRSGLGSIRDWTDAGRSGSETAEERSGSDPVLQVAEAPTIHTLRSPTMITDRKPDDDLAALAKRINTLHGLGLDASRKGVKYFREAGEMLLQVKEKVGHGNW